MRPLVLALLLLQAPPSGSNGNSREVGIPIGKGKTKPRVQITSPRGGWTVGRMMRVQGTVSDRSVDPVVLSINGDRYFIRVVNGRFSREFPAASGKNVVTAMATNRGGTGRDQVTCYAQIPPVPLKVVLTGDMDGVYTDLHIYEPAEGAFVDGKLDVEKLAHVYWRNTESPSGGTFYLNSEAGNFDQPGYGPYLYIHRAPPKGLFVVGTNYWPSGDKPHTVASLNVSLFEGTPQEIRRTVSAPLATRGTTKVLAWINVHGPGEASVYVPAQDPLPSGPQWPANMPEATEALVRLSSN